MSGTSTGPKGYPSDARECARILIAEGRFGGRQIGAGRPRTPRASEIVAAAAMDHAQAIVDALVAGIAEGQSPKDRSNAAERWTRLVIAEGALQQREHAEHRADVYACMSPEELRAEAASFLAQMIRSGELEASVVGELAAPADAEAIEDLDDAA